MSGLSRTKGKAGEREIAAIVRDITGWDVRRRVRQHDSDDDLVGIPGWAPEVKRHKAQEGPKSHAGGHKPLNPKAMSTAAFNDFALQGVTP